MKSCNLYNADDPLNKQWIFKFIARNSSSTVGLIISFEIEDVSLVDDIKESVKEEMEIHECA